MSYEITTTFSEGAEMSGKSGTIESFTNLGLARGLSRERCLLQTRLAMQVPAPEPA